MNIELNDTQKNLLKEICKDLADKNSFTSKGTKRRKIKISKKDIMIALFMKNEIELGKQLDGSTAEDINGLVSSIFVGNNDEQIAKLKEEREKLKNQITEISKKINALKLKKTDSNITVE